MAQQLSEVRDPSGYEAWLLQPRVEFCEEVTAVHAWFFHGLARRGESWYPFEEDCTSALELPCPPLEIWRSGRAIPPITRPATNLVITTAVASALGVGTWHLNPTVWGMIIEEFYERGDQSYESTPLFKRNYRDLRAMIRQGTPMPRAAWPKETLLEVIVPNVVCRCEHGEATSYVICDSPVTPMLRTVINHVTAFVVEQTVFRKIARYVDADYFHIRPITMQFSR